MGNQSCVSNRHPMIKEMLLIEEQQKLRQLYDKLISRFKDTFENDYLSQECFEQLMPDKPEIAQKLFKYLQGGQKLNFENFKLSVGYLLNSETKYRLTMTGLYTVISVERIDLYREGYQQEKISYLDALDFLMEIEHFMREMHYYVTHYEQSEEQSARSILSRIFFNNSGSIPYDQFTAYIESLLPYLSNFLFRYFQTIFFGSIDQNLIGRFQKPSYLLNSSQLCYLSLSSQIIQDTEQFNLIWTSGQYGWQFESLYQALITYRGPTLILLKFDQVEEDDEEDEQPQSNRNQKKYSIVGALNAQQWIETNSYQGTSQNSLFQVYPQFNAFPVQQIQQDIYKSRRSVTTNYSYLNNRDRKQGLGFGGDMKVFRLWIDSASMQQSSYVQSQAEPYVFGNLTDPSIQTSKLSYFEAWGLHDSKLTVSSSDEETKANLYKINNLLDKFNH